MGQVPGQTGADQSVARGRYPSYWVPVRALYDALIPYDPSTNQPRGYCVLCRPAKPAPALLKLNASAPVWPSLYAPLAGIAAAATSYEALVAALADVLRSPTGLPQVTSRYGDANAGTLTALATSPSFDVAEGAKAYSEYRRGMARLRRHFAESSALCGELRTADELWETETAVFVLALLTARDIRERMAPAVRLEVEARLRRDLADPTIGAEVENVRRQIEGLTECALEGGGGACLRGSACCGGAPAPSG